MVVLVTATRRFRPSVGVSGEGMRVEAGAGGGRERGGRELFALGTCTVSMRV